MKNNIILIGMPASGKTTIGIELSKVLYDYTFVDTDSFIEKTTGLKITEIFKKYSEDNRATLLNFGKVFYLKSDLDILYCRASKDNSRPLLQSDNPKEVLEKLLSKREDNYSDN